jgi:hypothetical protein
MRMFAFMLLLVLAGCAGNSALGGYCSVLSYAGGTIPPAGLIILDPATEAHLRAQLPAEVRNSRICWYTTGVALIAGERRNPQSFVYGRVFEKGPDGSWMLTDKTLPLSAPNSIN